MRSRYCVVKYIYKIYLLVLFKVGRNVSYIIIFFHKINTIQYIILTLGMSLSIVLSVCSMQYVVCSMQYQCRRVDCDCRPPLQSWLFFRTKELKCCLVVCTSLCSGRNFTKLQWIFGQKDTRPVNNKVLGHHNIMTPDT